jgi:two-component system OmpR family sensor kinase
MRALIRRTPLRVRLVVASTLLLVAGLAVSGLVAAHTLRGYLLQRVDDQLRDAAGRPFVAGPPGGRQADGDDAGGPLSQFYVALLSSTGTVKAVSFRPYDNNLTTPQLHGLTSAKAVALDGAPFTVGSAAGDGSWRAIAQPAGTAGTVVVAESLADVDRTVSRLELLELVVGLAVVALLAGAGYLVVRRTLRPLTDVEETAAAIAAGDLARRVPEGDPRTEVGRLSAALNGMLQQIELAFRVREQSEAAAHRSAEQVRQFVADASHELRTPLTSIRGFAELFRQGAVADEAELARVMRRIEDEAARMGVLVDDLLLLARLDQRRPLERRPVDLAALARDAVDDAQAVAPSRSLTLDVRTDSAIVVGDELRLRQVLGNLVGNALTHTPPTAAVTVRVSDRADETGVGSVVLEVADEGPGLPEADAARVFERFYRADPSRTRDQGGTGLGLSIVASLAEAHGGSVEVDTAVGAGATFRVVLPRPTEIG